MWLVKYLLFFSTAIVSAIGAGAVIAGIIVFLIFAHYLPAVITEFIRSNLSFLDALPTQLAVLGSVVCLSTLLGCCGAILDGNVGKWLLITYTIELIIFVALNIHIAVVLHLAHKKTPSSGSRAAASPLIMDPRLGLDTDIIDATQSNNLPNHKAETKFESPFLVRQRRDLFSGTYNKVTGIVHDASGAFGNHIKKGKDFAGDVVNKAGDIVSSGVNKVGEKIESGKNLMGTVGNMGKAALAIPKLAMDATVLIVSMFNPLSQEEQKAVEWIKPILGMYTTAVFRLTKSRVVMTAWASAIGVEVFFILLNIYLTTTKKRYYDTMENVC